MPTVELELAERHIPINLQVQSPGVDAANTRSNRDEPDIAAGLLELCLGHRAQISSLTDCPATTEEGSNMKVATRWRLTFGVKVRWV
ncbi:hypothetical protein MDA_GLEAN10002451 [Myotis davidii]|uniref:Uncharacterized protein n=1 Tax=Myotis davidii TaxID=225400 RepID=L5LU05_MYODS|nr:hypothetical protein MDA_GLEAN10002451 [Myotis davidii]